jgi:hypothetical protein
LDDIFFLGGGTVYLKTKIISTTGNKNGEREQKGKEETKVVLFGFERDGWLSC